MSPALVVILLFRLLSFALGVAARRGRDMSLEQWSVGGRGFGAVFVFLLMAGEIYTTFTFLGGSGWAYGKGAPAFYILCYGALGYAISYFLLPIVWRYATEHKLHSQADYFVKKYDSTSLGVLASLVSVVAMVPYLVLQLKGLGIIVSEASYGRISNPVAIWVGIAVLVSYVMVSGVHGSAWTAVVKDFMILGVAVALGIYFPYHYFGGYQPMFEAIEKAKPGFLSLPAKGMSASWFLSTVLMSGIAFYAWPHTFASSYTAKNESVFRKNAVVMPLYQLVLLFVFFSGFAAILQVPGLKGAEADLSLFRLSKLTFPPLLVGVIGAAGVLTALVPGSMLLMSAGTIFAKNVFRPLAPRAPDRTLAWVARGLVPALALIATWWALHGGDTLVPLLLMGYSFVTQLCPALYLSLGRQPLISKASAIAGIVAGETLIALFGFKGWTLAKLFPSWPSVITDLNIGIVALVVNLAVMAVVSAATRRARVEVPAAAA